MNPYARFALVLSVLAALVLPGCGAQMSAPTQAPQALATRARATT